MKVTPQIFLSYERRDEKRVESLYQELSAAGFKPWMDRKDILPGERWETSIRRAIRESDFFLACLSATSVNKRGFLQKEIRSALDIWQEKLDSDIYLIPVRLEDCEVPHALSEFQWVDLFEEDGWSRLLRALQVGMERLTEQTPSPQPARTEGQLDQPKSQTKPVTPLSVEPEAPAAERRHLTVMLCDLAGLTVQLDPEDLSEVVRAYQAVCSEVISRFEGHIAQYRSDELLVCFGYPVSHEDDAQRAVRAGMEILAAVPRLNAQLQQTVSGVALQARVGIHTGLVVTGEMGQTIVGNSQKIAAHLLSLAEPNTIAISDATHQLIRDVFVCQDLDAHIFTGLPQPMRVYRVLHEWDVQSIPGASVIRGLTPLVGREQEVGLLLQRWEQVKEGLGQVVLLSGEAGIGKSRLVQVLKERVEEEPHIRLECRCSPYHQNSALYPVIDLLERALEFSREDSPQEKIGKMEGTLERFGVSSPEVVSLFASLLSLPLSDRYPPLTLSPERQKQKTLEALTAVLLEMAKRRPVLLIVEDLHWIDPSSLELLDLLVDQGPTARLFTLLTFRPQFRPPWAIRSHLIQLTLNRLPHKQVEVMVEKVTGGKALPAEVLQQVVDKTDGVPLFVEELTKMVLESGLLSEHEGRYELTGPLPRLAIPATLHDSLEARLNRLARGKEVAQLGAAIGREFTYELLQALSPLDETTLQSELDKLAEAELLYRRGLPPRATYIFKHALIQDAAYQSLLKSKRQQYHRQIVQMLEERFPEVTETQPELLAHHCTEASLPGKAIVYWQRAGQRAIERSAHVEAINHLTRGLEVLTSLPDASERIQQELLLQTTLGPALMATKGYAAPEVERAYARARTLCQQMGETPRLFVVLRGLYVYYLVRGALQTAYELGEQCLRLAQSVNDPALLLEAHFALGQLFLFQGDFVPAREHLVQGIALYNPQQHHPHAFLYGHDPGVACLSLDAATLWLLGYPERALQRSREALDLAQELSHPFSLAWAMIFAAAVHQLRGEVQAAQERAEAVMSLSAEQGFVRWLAWGRIWRGWALAEQGQGEDGIAQMRQGLADDRATGAESAVPYTLGLLAEGYRKCGRVEEGLVSLEEALAVVSKNGERNLEAELHRLRGELLCMKGEAETGAEGSFRHAINIARRQSAKSLELRAVMSLSRLLQKQGKKEEARQMLAEIYDRFTEGFDTADLKEAKALLESIE